jgi:predicted acyltransferase
MDAAPTGSRRIVSLDQFRGYTVAGMLLVNFIGSYAVVHTVFKHRNTYCGYADTIMPQFFFAVGFAYRLTFLRRLATDGWSIATRAVLSRNAGLILLGFVLYHLDGKYAHWSDLQNQDIAKTILGAFRKGLFQTLVHIALASLWILPVIAARAAVRVAYLLASAALHLYLSHLFYFDWAWNTPEKVIDGGQLGFLTWSIHTLVGSLAYDAMARANSEDPHNPVPRLAGWSLFLMAVGYGLACMGGTLAMPPFVEPDASVPVTIWTMSQRTGSASYQIFGAGFSLAVYAMFVQLCDHGQFRSRVFSVFGQNALAAYILHGMVASAVKPFVPNDCPLWYLAIGFSIYFGICFLLNSYLEKHRLFLKL